MKRWHAAVLILAIVLALVPEMRRYAAERRLYRASAALQLLIARPASVPDPQRVLEWIASTAQGTAAALPGDWRPESIAGTAHLLANRPGAAVDVYRSALALGERPEIDLNLGLAYETLGRRDAAAAALLRAGWISPAVLSTLPENVRALLLPEIGRLEQELKSGASTTPPPLPVDAGR